MEKKEIKCKKCGGDNLKVVAVTIKNPVSIAVLKCLKCQNEQLEDFSLKELFDVM